MLQFAAAQFAANVTGGGAQVVISRTGNLSASLTVTLSSPGGHDITAFAETVTIGPNMTSQIVTIPISNDGQPGESNTIIPLTLSSPGAEQRSARPRPPASSSTTTTRSRPLRSSNRCAGKPSRSRSATARRQGRSPKRCSTSSSAGSSPAPVILRLISLRASRRRRSRKRPSRASSPPG